MLALLFTASSSKQKIKIKIIKIYIELENRSSFLNIKFLNEIKKKILIDFFIENIFYDLIYIFIIKLLLKSIFIVRYFLLRKTSIFIKKRNELSQKNAINLI